MQYIEVKIKMYDIKSVEIKSIVAVSSQLNFEAGKLFHALSSDMYCALLFVMLNTPIVEIICNIINGRLEDLE